MRPLKLLVHSPTGMSVGLGLLIIRMGVGLMMAFSHGLGKVQQLLAGGDIKWADPIGIGMGPSLFLAGTTEFFCSLAFSLELRAAKEPIFLRRCLAKSCEVPQELQQSQRGKLPYQ